ncbi:MAG: alpha/beta hydrolase, partial [Cyanobacteria bacterium P01_C01_bin.121]
MTTSLPARSADNIYLDYGPFGRVLPTTSLESFAENGTIDDELAPYLKLVETSVVVRGISVL